MKETRGRKLFAWILSVLMVVSLLPAVAFGEEDDSQENLPFSIRIEGAEPSSIVKSEKGYTPYAYSYTENKMVASDPVPLYTVTVPEGARRVEISTVENCLMYNYKDGATYLSGYYEDSFTGGTFAESFIDANDDGAADYIQVQTPYDESWNSTTLYAITFEGNFAGKGERTFVSGNASADALRANIASEYVKNGAGKDSNTSWIVTDMMAYQKLFPAGTVLTDEQKQSAADWFIDQIEEGRNLEKNIIALASLGIDASRLTTAGGEELDGVDTLLKNTFEEGSVKETAKSIYTLPWAIIALQQFGNRYQQELSLMTAALKELADSNNEGNLWAYEWEGVKYFDIYSISAALQALAPLYEENSFRITIDTMLEKIRHGAGANEKGAVLNGTDPSAENTGLLICALTSLAKDPDDFFKDSSEDLVKLSEGLLSMQDSSSKGFVFSESLNPISTEQGFRGLLAMAGGPGYDLYDFSGQTLKPADSSKWNTVFKVVPEDAIVKLTKPGEESEIAQVRAGSNAYLLEAGEYTYTVSKDGYNGKTGTVTVTTEDAEKGNKIREFVSLTKEKPSADSNTVDVTVQVLVHDGETCKNSVTYKNEPEKFTSLLNAKSYTAKLEKNEDTARDALVEALDDSGLSYVEQSNGYFSRIGDFTEFGHGAKSGWLYMVNGKAGTSAMQDVKYSRNGTLTVFFTDDYSNDYGSENWGGGSSSGKDKDKDPADDPADDPGKDPVDNGYYDDTKDHWAEDTINKVTDRGWMKGVADRKFAPDTTLSRGMFVTMLYRIEMPWAGAPDKKEPWPENGFTDVEKGSWYEEAVAWAAACGIVKGTSDTTFSPNADVTREQMAAFLYRYNELKAGSRKPEADPSAISHYTDADQISGYAKEPLSWAVENGLINGVAKNRLQPKGNATRAQAATIVIRFDERAFSNGTAGN